MAVVVAAAIMPISCFNLSIKTEEEVVQEDMLPSVDEKGLTSCVNNLIGRRQPSNNPISLRSSLMMT